jgi:tRNA threonylcarbamoyladenosine biosynthesis protein TsaB
MRGDVGGMTATRQLALDASAGPASVALFADAQLVHAVRIERQGSAELLAPTVEIALREVGWRARELTGVIVGAGPGSFTGLRVTAAFAKGLARGAGATLYAVSSLALIAAADDAAAPGQYLAVLDALRDEWFMQAMQKDGAGRWTVHGPMQRVHRDVVQQRAQLESATLVGPPVNATQQPDARAALHIGATAVDRDAWEPDYGRLAEAQVQWEVAHAQPLPRA